jgi:hypothetical protein
MCHAAQQGRARAARRAKRAARPERDSASSAPSSSESDADSDSDFDIVDLTPGPSGRAKGPAAAGAKGGGGDSDSDVELVEDFVNQAYSPQVRVANTVNEPFLLPSLLHFVAPSLTSTFFFPLLFFPLRLPIIVASVAFSSNVGLCML